MSHAHIHERDLPFSEDEFFRAFCLVQSEQEARESARYVSEIVRSTPEGAERARAAREQGSDDPVEIAEPAWHIGDGAFALLAMVSGELRTRVEDYMRGRWEAERPSLLRATLHRAGRSIHAEPGAEDLEAVERVIGSYEAEWRQVCDRMQAEAEHHAGGGSSGS